WTVGGRQSTQKETPKEKIHTLCKKKKKKKKTWLQLKPRSFFRNGPAVDQTGFDNLAYEYGSQSELLSTKPISRASFKLLGLTCGPQDVESTLSHLKGVSAIIWTVADSLLQVEYDASFTTTKEISLQLQTLGCRVEAAIRIKVDGMRCQSCVQAIEGQVGEMQGVSYIQVSLQDGVALIVYQPLLVTQHDLRDKIEDMGFDATLFPEESFDGDLSCWQSDLNGPIHIVNVWIGGMTCRSCVQSIEGRICQMVGVKSVIVSLKEDKGTISFDPSLTDAEHVRAAIEEMGFDASLKGKICYLPWNFGSLCSSSKTETSKGAESQVTSTSCCPYSPEIKAQKCFIRVAGMTCASCVANIEKNMLKHKGIISVLVSLMAGKAEVKYDPNLLDPAGVSQLIEDLGFGAELLEDNAVTQGKLDLQITGMTCASCVHKIESKLTSTKGIHSASVALATKKAQIQFDPEVLGARDIVRIIQSLGFETSLEKTGFKNNLDHSEEIRQWKNSFLLSLVFGLPVMGLMIYMMIMDIQHKDHGGAMPEEQNILPGLSLLNLAFFLLCTPVQSKTSEALVKLMSLQATDATVVTLGTDHSIIEVELVQRGDVVKVVPGGKFPIDGKVIEGSSMADESLITGEPMPVTKRPGSLVMAGSINGHGALLVEATHVGAETTLSQIVKLVEEAQTSKAPIQQFADKMSGYFVPFIIIASLITLVAWMAIGFVNFDIVKEHFPVRLFTITFLAYRQVNLAELLLSASTQGYNQNISKAEVIVRFAFQASITVLSIACPCSLGLATPTAVMVGTGVGAQNGILIKGGEPLEMAHKVIN
uniref:P-type Cu(+) transporter n=1 Tax=Cyprinodon variegatus TaxID=28743 RepID=A0A3Q2D1E6_CYPVA